MNVCGVLVHAMPEKIGGVIGALESLEGVEVHGTAEGARIIVTIEDTGSIMAIDQLAKINRVDGIVAASLVYHQFEPAEAAATL